MPLLKKGEYATHIGVGPSYVTELLKKGVIVADANGRIDSDDADRRRAETRVNARPDVAARIAATKGRTPPVEPGAAPGPGPAVPQTSASSTYQQAKTFREGYEARMAKLKYEEATGVLVLAADVKKEQFEIYRRVAAGLDQLPDRLAPMLAAETDAFVIRGLIEVEIHRIRDELADNFEAQAGQTQH